MDGCAAQRSKDDWLFSTSTSTFFLIFFFMALLELRAGSWVYIIAVCTYVCTYVLQMCVCTLAKLAGTR